MRLEVWLTLLLVTSIDSASSSSSCAGFNPRSRAAHTYSRPPQIVRSTVSPEVERLQADARLAAERHGFRRRLSSFTTLEAALQAFATGPPSTVLDLKGSALPGQIPSWIGNLTSLTYLDLSGNLISGSIPPEIGKLTNLQYLSLAENQLIGTVPSSLKALTALTSLDFSYNQELTGPIPPELGQLASLQVLNLAFCGFVSSIPPELGALSALTNLDLTHNKLTGGLPAALGQLSQLTVMKITSNKLSGSVPPEIWNLTKLTTLSMGSNRFTGDITGIGKLTALSDLLDLNSNSFSGTGWQEIVKMPKLSQFWGETNAWSGTLPPEIGSMAYMNYLGLAHNQITGTLPKEWAGLANVMPWPLWGLNLQNNKLTGSIPDEWRVIYLTGYLALQNNQMSGPIPSWMGSWAVPQLALNNNFFTGSIPPDLLQPSGNWTNNAGSPTGPAKVIDLSNNLLTGTLPTNFFGVDVNALSLAGNVGLTGALPDMTARALNTLNVSGCSFTSAGPLSSTAVSVDISHNKLTSLPPWDQHPKIGALYLNDNNIASWPPRGVLSPIFDLNSILNDGGLQCNRQSAMPRFTLPSLTFLDVSNNPLGVSAYVFIASLTYFELLTTLKASNCSLTGPIPHFYWMASFNTGIDAVCNGHDGPYAGFRSLSLLQLSKNAITAISQYGVKTGITTLDVSYNSLQGPDALARGWWNENGQKGVQNLNVQGNPNLTTSIIPPVSDSCDTSSISTSLTADSRIWLTVGSAECAQLCNPRSRTYVTDLGTLDVVDLCRCLPGKAGRGQACTGCPVDTFSASSVNDTYYMTKACSPCPAISSTMNLTNQTNVCGCKCAVGYYMDLGLGGTTCPSVAPPRWDLAACRQCPVFRTTQAVGSVAPSGCVCDVKNVLGLQDGGLGPSGYSECGCSQGYFMNWQTRGCQRCSSSGENCDWTTYGLDNLNSTIFNRSLYPPALLNGYWATSTSVTSFAGHDIWHCESALVCKGPDGACAENRFGRACALCLPGFTPSSTGDCQPCPSSVTYSQISTCFGLVAIWPICMLVHVFLIKEADNTVSGLTALKDAGSQSVKQLLKFFQVMGILSTFQMHWPVGMQSVFSWLETVTGAAIDATSLACFTGDSTATSALTFLWLTPPVIIGVALFTPFTARPLGFLMIRSSNTRIRDLGTAFRYMGLADILKVVLWVAVILFTTLLRNGLILLACQTNPNGKLSVSKFLYLECGVNSSTPEWRQLLPGCITYMILVCASIIAITIYAWSEVVVSLVESNYERRGRWHFLCNELRVSAVHWPVVVLSKDLSLNIIAAVFSGNPVGQLVLTALISLAYALATRHYRPFRLNSANNLEVWSAGSIFMLLFLCAAFGFQSPEDVQFVGGATAVLLVAQSIALIGAMVLAVVQILNAITSTRRYLPQWMKTWSDDETDHLRLDCVEQLIDGRALEPVVKRFDTVDLVQFVQLLRKSTASVGHISPGFGDHVARSVVLDPSVALLRKVHLRRSNSNLSEGALSSPTLRSSDAVGNEVNSEVDKLGMAVDVDLDEFHDCPAEGMPSISKSPLPKSATTRS